MCCIMKYLHLWGTSVLRFPHSWFDIGNICAGPLGNIWKTFLGFYDMQSDLCFGTSVWFSPVALPASNVLLIGILLGDWKKTGFLTFAGRQEMFQKNPHMVRIPQKEKMLSHGFSSLQLQLTDHREQVEGERELSYWTRTFLDVFSKWRHLWQNITLATKVRTVKAMAFSIVMYRCESWTIKETECQIIDAFQLWCWWRLLRVPWPARRSN